MAYIPRTLWHLDSKGERQQIAETDLFSRPEPLAVHDEPGMGERHQPRCCAVEKGNSPYTARGLVPKRMRRHNRGGK